MTKQSKLKSFNFATASLSELQKRLTSLKKDEAKLELALTLRKCPELEEALTRLVTIVVELQNVEKLMKFEVSASEESPEQLREQIDFKIKALKVRIAGIPANEAGNRLKAMYEEQVKTLETQKETAGFTKKTLKYLEHFNKLLSDLTPAYEFIKVQLPQNFDLCYEVPNLEKYLKFVTVTH